MSLIYHFICTFFLHGMCTLVIIFQNSNQRQTIEQTIEPFQQELGLQAVRDKL